MLEIYGINVTLMVANLDRAILFYTEILGLKLKAGLGITGRKSQAQGLPLVYTPHGSLLHQVIICK